MESLIAQDLNIKYGKFMFTIKYFDGTIRIEALHEEEHLLWANTFDNILSSNKEDKQLILKTSPSMIYKLLSNYANGKNDQYVAIKFPEKYKSPDDAICIEINIKLPYDENCDDSKILVLYSVKVSIEERFNKKIAFTYAKLTDHIEENSKKNINDISSIIAGIDKRHTDTTNILNSAIGALKTELLSKITADINSATGALKTELLSKITNEINALRTEITNKLNTELAKYQLKA